ncbi:MAG: DUF2804 domain-containing protein [Thermoleophilaceae bacterium]
MERVPLPPARMPLLRRGRPLKRWRYVGFYGPELMLCAGDVSVGPLRQQFWAVAERDEPLRERTALRSAGVTFEGPRVKLNSDGVGLDLVADEGAGVETVHPSGRHGYVWTRKQAGVPMRGTLTLDGRRIELAGEGSIDQTAGYHSRHTSWRWSTGAGRATDGRRVAWNLVEGVNDAPEGSERAIWVGGEPFEPAPVRFADDLSAIDFSEGGRLEFAEWPGSSRDDHTNALLLRSDYRQPFGAFAGELPGGIRLAEAFGVMEIHSAVW